MDAAQIKYRPHGAASRKRLLRTTFHFFRAMDLFYRKHYAQAYNPLVNGLVLSAIYGAFSLAVLRGLLTPVSRRRVGF